MAERSKTHDLLTVEEYLKLEETATVKHEYVAGTIHAMVGTTKRHNQIAGNIFAHLWNRARGGPCRVYASDVKVRIDDVVYYPDVMVACEPADDDPLVEHTPCLIVEVTSPGTESIDRREKVFNYRKIPSLKAYLIVDQSRHWIERHWRDDEGYWRQGGLNDGAIPVPCPETRLPLDEAYEGLE
jgi:Uma2 family endonuclease